MTVGNVLTAIGESLQLAGLGIAGIGVRRARVKHAPERRGIERQTMDWFGALTRLFQPLPPVEETVTVAPQTDTAEADMTEKIEWSFAPEATATEREKIVVERLHWLQGEMDRIKESVAAERRERRAAVDQLGGTVNEEADNLRRVIDSAMADGLTQETLGLWLAAAGAVLAIIGAVI